MKKRILSIILTLCMVLTLLPSFTQPALAVGEGTGNPANGAFALNTSGVNIITNADQLAYMAKQIDDKVAGWVSASYKLGNNIDLSAYPSWEPIGRHTLLNELEQLVTSPFTGTFDGAGFAIKNLKVNTAKERLGFIAELGAGGTVKNLALIDSSILGGDQSGMFVGLNRGTIQNCYSNGEVIKIPENWIQQVGGIVGQNLGTIENCYFSGSVCWGSVDFGPIIGGNYSAGKLLNCYYIDSRLDGLGSELGAAQMQGFASATNSGWSDITISGVNQGKLSLVDALNIWVSAQAPGNFTPWYCSSADGKAFPGFAKEEFIVNISDGTGVGTPNTTASASLTGAITSGTTCVAPGETVTIKAGAPDSAYKAGTVSVYKTGESATTVATTLASAGEYTFTMPRYPVTIATSYASKSGLNQILSFNFANPAVSLSSSNNTVTVIVSNGTNVSSLIPTITVSPNATINPMSGVAQNFASDVTYTVTAENGSTKNWTITVLIQTAPPTGIGFDAVTSMLTGISDDMEYSVNGGSAWVKITGSVNGKVAIAGVNATNDIQVRNNGTAPRTAPSVPSTIDITQAITPSAPAISAVTVNSVTLTPVNGYEYSRNGFTWQASNLFDSLSPATVYTFYQRVAAYGTTLASIKSDGKAQSTAAAAPSAGEGYSVNYDTETITVNSGYEVNTSAGFGAGTAVANNATLTPGATYYIRVAANGAVPASSAVSFTTPARPAAPTGITADKTKNSITITSVTGQEYKIGSGAWQDSGSFTGLPANTDHTVYARVKAVSDEIGKKYSFASEVFSTTIKTKSDGSSAFALPTISVSPTYAPGKKLDDIPLPTGWAWSAPDTVPTVTNSGYNAVYTPADTATVDYSSVSGYAVDGIGKVTITCTVPLTVNRATPTAADFAYTAPASLDYSGTAKTAAVAVKDGISGMGAVTVRYYLGGNETSPTNAGTYTVKIDIAQGDNYALASAITDNSWTFTIAKVAQTSLSITGKPASVTYGDTFNLSTTGGSGTGAVTWAVTSGSSATVNENSGTVIITGVGETTITATKAADGDYTNAVTNTYTFTPGKLIITVDAPSTKGGWTKTYDGKKDFDKSGITVGGITNKVGSDAVNVTVQSAAYDTADVGSGNKTLTITYAIDGTNSGNYTVPKNTEISTASITAATPTITLKNKTETYTGKKVEIDAATVKGTTGGTTPDGAITYTYYTKDTCTDADKTSVDKSGAEAIGGAPKMAGTYYVKANIAASGNYVAATSAAVTLTIYYPSSGGDKPTTPIIVDGKTVYIGTFEVKEGTTTVKVDQNKMSEQLKNAKDSVVIPVTSKTDTASAQLVVQNVENMAARSITLTVKANDVNYEIPAGSVDTAAILKNLGASDSAKVPLNVTISKLSNNAVTIKDGTLMVAPVAFTITATYNGKNVEVEKFENYVQRVIEIPSGVDPKKITTAVVVEENGTQRHVPTEVYSVGGKWYAKINSITNSTYALIQSNASFTDSKGKWYGAIATEMASRKIMNGNGKNMFVGDLSITKAEFAAILVRALGLPANGTSTFSDVSASEWYSGAVATAAQYGLVIGNGKNNFNPNAAITRQQAMLMLQRAAALTEFRGVSGDLDSFSDANNVSSWAKDAAKWSIGSGIIQGVDGKLNPTANITRAESATIILRLLQKAGLVDVRS